MPRAFISLVSKVEVWLMAHLEATLMHTTNNHFKTLFGAICGFTGQKLLKLGHKIAKNQPKYPNLAIRLERKVLETPFLHKHMQSVKNTIFGSKIAISRPLINLNMTTFNIRPTPKIFLTPYTTPTKTPKVHYIYSYKKPGNLLKI